MLQEEKSQLVERLLQVVLTELDRSVACATLNVAFETAALGVVADGASLDGRRANGTPAEGIVGVGLGAHFWCMVCLVEYLEVGLDVSSVKVMQSETNREVGK